MPRPRKTPTPTEVPAAVAVEQPLVPDVPAAEPPVTAATGAQWVSVGVRNRCPWGVVQSAGSPWGREPTLLPATDPRLPELRRCEWLTVVEV